VRSAVRRGLSVGGHADREAMRVSGHAFRGRLPEGMGAMERSRSFRLLEGRHLRVVRAVLVVVTLAFAGLPIGAAVQTTSADPHGEASAAS
jgi:hypothetical protein